ADKHINPEVIGVVVALIFDRDACGIRRPYANAQLVVPLAGVCSTEEAEGSFVANTVSGEAQGLHRIVNTTRRVAAVIKHGEANFGAGLLRIINSEVCTSSECIFANNTDKLQVL